MSTNKPQLCLVALILIIPTLTHQTVIKRAESENKPKDRNTINDHKEDSHLPNDNTHFFTQIRFNRQTNDKSGIHIANYSLTNKEKESDLNSTKSVIGTVVNSKDDTISLDIIENSTIITHDVRKKEKNYVESNYTLKHIKTIKANPRVSKKTASNLGNKPQKFKDNLKLEQRDITNAVEFGVKALEKLVKDKEPHLYKLGLFLEKNDPAARVASFGAPANRKAILLSRIGYATLEASKKIAETYDKNVGRQSAGLNFELQPRIDLEECPLKGQPRCPPASRRFRTSDGTCNNLQHLWRGSAMLPMQRFLPPVYEDGIQNVRLSVAGTPLPSPREISTVIHRDRNQEILSVTLLFTQFGQFIDHDLTSTVKSSSFNASIPRCCENGGTRILPPELLHPSCLPIEVPRTDPFLSRFGIGCMEFIRSAPSTRINCKLGWREQINQVTSYLDASTIYGSDIDTSDSIRTFRNGKLFYGRPSEQEPLNPPDPPGRELCREGALSDECLQPGDSRFSENPGLIAIHTIFVRYHNKLATVLSTINPHWTDERIFQETRRIVFSVIQHITYREYLPIVLGPEVMDLFELRILKKEYYDKYDERVDAATANSFSSAAFRFGHSMIQNSFIRTDSHHIPLPNNVSLHDEISNFENIWSFGSIDRFLLGLSNQPSQRRDEFIADELTNHLFQFSDVMPFGMDLAAINIQRGRDHGIPPYTFWRKPCGLSPINDWRDLERVMSISSVIRLRSLYTHIDDIDLFTGGLAEKSLKGAVVGPTFACIIAQQFSNLRKGDRFWYENEGFESSFSPAQLQQIKTISLAQIMCQTMDEIETIQPFVFLSADNFRNVRASCQSSEIGNFDLKAWEEAPFEFNSISNNIDLFGEERSQKEFFDFDSLRHNNDLTLNNKRNLSFNLNETDKLFIVPEVQRNISIDRSKIDREFSANETNLTGHNRQKRQLQSPRFYRYKRETNKVKNKKNKSTTERPHNATIKTKNHLNKKITKTKTTTIRPKLPSESKYSNFNNVPNKPTFSVHSTSRPTKDKPSYYQIQDSEHDDVTYLFGLVPERTTKPPAGYPLQLNINIQYSPLPATTATSVSTQKKKRLNTTTRPAIISSSDYVTSRPTTANVYKPTQTYYQDDVVIITRRPITSTKRPTTIPKRPETVSYPIIVYSPAYDKPNYQDNYDSSTQKGTYFFDNTDYTTTHGHKRPNYNGFGNNDRPRPISVSNSASDLEYFVRLSHTTTKRPTTGYYNNGNDDAIIDDNEDKKHLYIPTNTNYQNTYKPQIHTIFEDQPFSTSYRPTYNKYTDRHTTKRPTYSSSYYDDDTVIITGNKIRPQTTVPKRDEITSSDDILNEFFQRYAFTETTNRRSSDSTTADSIALANINDKLDFKSRIIYRKFDDNVSKEEQFVPISTVKKEVLAREGEEEIIKENNNKSESQRRKIRSPNRLRLDIIPSEPSGEWKVFNATDETRPFLEVPELPINLPCSYEVPKPMAQFLPSPEILNGTTTS